MSHPDDIVYSVGEPRHYVEDACCGGGLEAYPILMTFPDGETQQSGYFAADDEDAALLAELLNKVSGIVTIR